MKQIFTTYHIQSIIKIYERKNNRNNLSQINLMNISMLIESKNIFAYKLLFQCSKYIYQHKFSHLIIAHQNESIILLTEMKR
jgi:hypothetical protein